MTLKMTTIYYVFTAAMLVKHLSYLFLLNSKGILNEKCCKNHYSFQKMILILCQTYHFQD
jgi:hypothetical protein